MAKWDYDGPILEIDKLSISFFTRLREIPAVMDFSCVVQPGEAMGLVGESGCGKSTVALGVMQDLGVNGRIVGGSIKFKGRDLNEMSRRAARYSRLGNRDDLSGADGLAEPGDEDRQAADGSADDPRRRQREEAYDRALEVVTDVRLPDPERMLNSSRTSCRAVSSSGSSSPWR